MTETPIVCGILNSTPDSFYDGGKYNNLIDRAHQLVELGADWIDIGGESTRPGAELISAQEEIDRVIPIIESLNGIIPISIDTTKGEVALAARRAGATILNDVRGFQDEDMQVASEQFPISIVMHSRGRPQNMQHHTAYNDVVNDVKQWLLNQVSLCRSSTIIIDPGIGFAKTVQQNIQLLKNLRTFTVLPYPVMLGTSRKSFIGKVLDSPSADDRLGGSLATVADGLQKGARVFRVHDVKETKDMLTMLTAIH